MRRLDGIALLALGVALFVAGWCAGNGGILDVKDAEHRRYVDSVERATQIRVRREDSLRVRVAWAESATTRAQTVRVRLERRVDTVRVSGDTAALVAVLDSVIIVQRDEIRQLTDQVTVWRAMYQSADSGRRLLHDALHEAETLREAWKRAARRRFACTGGPSATVSLGGHSAVGLGVTCGWRF